MASYLFSTKPLPEPMLICYLLDTLEQILWNSNQNTNIFIQEHAFDKISAIFPSLIVLMK